MSATWSYRDALRELWERSNYDRGYIANPFGDRASGERGLARVRELLRLAGNPDDKMLVAHVAGSKGKGSTAAMIAAIAGAAGYRVGLYTSPHLHSFRERIAVDAVPIAEPGFARLAQRVAVLASELENANPELGDISAFELLTVMALAHFQATNRDLVVLEVGLGGTYDATNVVSPAVSVVTKLDLEHTAVLGSTLEAIATAKAGIFKLGVPVVSSPQPASVVTVLESLALERDSAFLVGGRDWRWTGHWRRFSVEGPWGTYRSLASALPGDHQMENAATAIAAAWTLNAGGFTLTEGNMRQGLRRVQLSGRFEPVPLANGVVAILDGAHTPASARALAETVRAEYPGRSVILVLGTSADKDVASLGRELAWIAHRVIATHSRSPRAVPATLVAAGLSAFPVAIEVQSSVADAVSRAKALAQPGDLIVITGSLFVVAEAREALGLGMPDPDPGGP